jgi:hypothetical protein
MYKNNRSILGLIKGRCKFTTSSFPTENLARKPATIIILDRCTQAEK